ncbi:MAG: polysaccharide biosynthesis/export family protein [Elusimicrobia bacterium]|nr:polysaccharide biosynthesis/export family protein [Elusimicrobiota bacterium]
MRLAVRLVLVFAVLAGPMGGVPAWAQAASPVLEQMREAEAAVPVGPGDVIAIKVFPVEEYSREVTIQPDGKIELPLIGALQVKGMAAREIQSLLESKYAKFVAGPKVTLNVRRFTGRRVAILGQVGAPGYYEYRDGMKLLELVSLAGGVRDLAKPSNTVILRQAGDKGQVVKVNLAAIMRGELDRNVALQPGDTVHVPKAAYTRSAEWMAVNILPWLSLATLAATVTLLGK